MTHHHFIAMNFEVNREVKLKINLTPEELKSKYDDKLKQEHEGLLYDVLSVLFMNLVGVKKIIVPGDFTSSRGAKAVSCSVKAAEGYLFPLKSSLVFIHKPVTYIRHSELKNVEFQRTGKESMSRTFDITLVRLKSDQQNFTLLSIDRDEQKQLEAYFKSAGVKITIQDDFGQVKEMKNSPTKSSKQQVDQDMNAEYGDSEESEDESYKSGDQEDQEDEDEEGEAQQEDNDEDAPDQDNDDVDMIDEEMDKKELRELEKENGK